MPLPGQRTGYSVLLDNPCSVAYACILSLVFPFCRVFSSNLVQPFLCPTCVCGDWARQSSDFLPVKCDIFMPRISLCNLTGARLSLCFIFFVCFHHFKGCFGSSHPALMSPSKPTSVVHNSLNAFPTPHFWHTPPPPPPPPPPHPKSGPCF